MAAGGNELRDRVAFVRARDKDGDWPDLSDDALLNSADAWLTPHLREAGGLDALTPDALINALRGLLDWEALRRLDRLAPEAIETPAGTRATIDYSNPQQPSVAVRVQELFGLDRHPSVMDARTPLAVHLLSPARRPVQITLDLPGFWRGSYRDVRSEMKGRYPKHPWPEDPLQAEPTTRAKPRSA